MEKNCKSVYNSLIFQPLKSVHYVPEVKPVQNICQIGDLENCWIAIKNVLVLSEKMSFNNKVKRNILDNDLLFLK